MDETKSGGPEVRKSGSPEPRQWRGLAGIALLTLALWAVWRLAFAREDALVVYCAHDAEFAAPVLAEFTRRTGIAVAVRYDSEATKSLGLVERLIAEAGSPACDVFWNNEQLGTMDLARRGLLAEHRGPGWSRMPPGARDADGRWTAFGARLRVVAWNRGRRAELGSPAAGAVAKPRFGTTLSHFSALWARHGGDAVRDWHGRRLAAGLRLVDGNAAAARLVASGACAWCWTDTDDACAVRDAGAPVDFAAATVDLADDRSATAPTIVIPNTVAVIAGAPRAAAARALADWLASAEVELLLARSPARQVPLGPVDAAALPEDVRALLPAARRGLDLGTTLAARAEVLEWLR